MKTLLPRGVQILIICLTVYLLPASASYAQSCSNNNIGFNSNTATNNLTICIGSTATTINGGAPAGATYQWEVATALTGPFAVVSPDPGSVGDYTVSSTYYGTPGIYFFRRVVSGSSGCDGNSDVVKLIVRALPVVTNSGTSSSSCAATGSITLYGSSYAPYTYSLDGITYQSGNTFSSLAAGTYTGYVTDANGCIGTKASIVISASSAPSVTGTARNASSCAADGSITLYRSGGVAPFTYSLDDVTYQSSNVFNGLASGTYTGWVKDGGGCKASVSGLAVGIAPAVTVTYAKSNTSACGNTGVIQLYGGGGVPGYTYSLDDITYQSSAIFSSLAAGTYTGWAKDSKGCKASVAGILIGVDPATVITVTSSKQNTSGCANDGSISLFQSGGVGPFTYSSDDITYQSSNTVTGLAAGTYTGWVKDSRGCKGSQAGIIIASAPALTTSERHSGPGVCVVDGSIQVMPSGGTAPYTYSLDDITYQSSNTFSSLAAGTYTGWVKDFRGCKASVSLSLVQNSPITVSASKTNASNCSTLNGTVTVYGSGGAGGYTYSLNGTTYQSANSFTGLASGFYTAYIKDSKGCVGTLGNVNVGPENTRIDLTSGSSSAAQSTCKNAAITDITYSITGGSGTSVTGLPSGVTGSYSAGVFTISGTATVAGTFNYTVTTTGACAPVTASGTITVKSSPVATYTKTMATSCGNGADGTITASASGTQSPYSYSWSGPGGYTASTAAITNLGLGDYDLTVTDAQGCSVTVPAITIWQAQSPTFTFSGSSTSSCANTAYLTMYGSYGVAPYKYSIDGSNYQTNNNFTSLGAGTYTAYVKDNGGCVGTRVVTISTLAPVGINSTSARASTTCNSNNGSIQIFRTTGGTSPYTYSIDGLNYQSSATFSNLAPGTYVGYIKDAAGCIATKTGIEVGPTGCSSKAPEFARTSWNGPLTSDANIAVQVSPNPSATNFVLTLTGFSTDQVIAIQVTDVFGRIVYQVKGNSLSYSFGSSFIPGIYNVQVMQGNITRTVRVIKE